MGRHGTCASSLGTNSVAGFENFLADLVRNEEQAERSDTSGRPLNGRSGRLAAQVLDEVVNASVLIAVTTAIANAAERDAGLLRRAGIAIYTPSDQPFFPSMVAALLDSDAGLETCRTVQAYCARLALARRLTQGLTGAGTGAREASARAATVDPEILADAWRRTCRAAIDCIETLSRGLGHGMPGGAEPNNDVLKLLRLAERGETPCLEPDGRVTIPGWAERRQEERRPMQLAATAQIGAHIMPVMIRDTSPSGLGLACTHRAGPGDRIVLRLPGDRTLLGRVAWADGQRIGVRLDQRLLAGDPLLDS